MGAFPELTDQSKFNCVCWTSAIVYLGLCAAAFVFAPLLKDKS